MKFISFFILLLAVAAGVLRADFHSPFADSKPGTTVISSGVIEADLHPGKETVYFVRFGTDTGPEKIIAEIPSELLQQEIVGRSAKITATVREREDAMTKKKIRFLEVLRIEVAK